MTIIQFDSISNEYKWENLAKIRHTNSISCSLFSLIKVLNESEFQQIVNTNNKCVYYANVQCEIWWKAIIELIENANPEQTSVASCACFDQHFDHICILHFSVLFYLVYMGEWTYQFGTDHLLLINYHWKIQSINWKLLHFPFVYRFDYSKKNNNILNKNQRCLANFLVINYYY